MNSATLNSLYEDREPPGRGEVIHDFVAENEWDAPFQIKQLKPSAVVRWHMANTEDSIADAFKAFATQDQKRYIAELRANKSALANEVLVADVSRKILLDGHHRIMAMALEKMPTVSVLDISAPDYAHEKKRKSLKAPFIKRLKEMGFTDAGERRAILKMMAYLDLEFDDYLFNSFRDFRGSIAARLARMNDDDLDEIHSWAVKRIKRAWKHPSAEADYNAIWSSDPFLVLMAWAGSKSARSRLTERMNEASTKRP